MQLPRSSATTEARVRFGRYVARRLRRAKLESLRESIAAVTSALKSADRAKQDALEPVEEARADRDAVDDELDTIAQELRNTLAGRSLDAVKSAPYTGIFPDGIGHYIGAPLDEQVQRYTQLAERIEASLPAADAERKKRPAQIRAALKEYREATASLSAAERAHSECSRALEVAVERFERQHERCYGALVAELGKSAAERFFPKVQRSRGKAAEPKDG